MSPILLLLLLVTSYKRVCATSQDEHNRAVELSSSIICEGGSCYPKHLEAKADWQEIKEFQHLPAGLDIRVNLDTGKTEARMAQADETFADQLSLSDDSTLQWTDDTTNYEFTDSFNRARELLSADSPEYESLYHLLDDLVEYASDYHHGYKIITHEFTLLKQLILGTSIPEKIKEPVSRIISGSLRNNDPSIQFVLDKHPRFIDRLLEEAVHYSKGKQLGANSEVLIKRYLSIINVLLDRSPQVLDENALLQLYHLDNKDISFRVLLLVAKIHRFKDSNERVYKRLIESPHASVWVHALSSIVQEESLDEHHFRELFTALHSYKEALGTRAKVDGNFLNWLAKECESRKGRLAESNAKRDTEQNDFDRLLVDSRHLIFGNPMAHRMKNFPEDHDEL